MTPKIYDQCLERAKRVWQEQGVPFDQPRALTFGGTQTLERLASHLVTVTSHKHGGCCARCGAETDPDHAVFLRFTETTQGSIGGGTKVHMDEVCPDCFAKRGSDYQDEPQKAECSHCGKSMEVWESRNCSRKFRRLSNPACCQSHRAK